MIWRDALYPFRTMRRQPAFAATAIATLALAIGGNTAMFTVLETVLLKPLPYPHSDELVNISPGASPTRFAEMKAQARAFSGIGASSLPQTPTLSNGAEPEVIKGVRISANFLRILGVEPLLGRAFRDAEDSAGAAPVVMISGGLWKRRFASDPGVLGKTAVLSGTPYTIIGVLPVRFSFPSADLDVWMTAPQDDPLMAPKSRTLSPFLTLFGRLKPGVTVHQAIAEAKVLHHQYALAHPAMLDAKPRRPVTVTAMKDDMVADVRSMLWMLVGAVGFVLLIACANVAGLLLARAVSRSREFAVRSAIGAGRRHIIVQLLSESIVLSLLGGALGMLLALWGLRAIPRMSAFELPRAHEIQFDWTVFAFAAAISIATGLLFGLAPAIGASQPDLMRALRMSVGVSHGPRSFQIRGSLLILQIALSIVLSIGTALLIESVNRLRGVALGFNAKNVLTASVSLPTSRYGTDEKQARFFEDLVDRLRTTQGIRSASASMFVPMAGFAGTPVQDAAKPLLRLNERLIATFNVVTPGYFHTLEIPLRRGRDFTGRDRNAVPRVAIIDEALARRFWPAYPAGRDPIGQHIWIGALHTEPAEIVGIVSHAQQTVQNMPWPETVYVPLAQNAVTFGTIALRTEAEPNAFVGALGHAVRTLDKDQAVSDVRTMDDLVDEQVGQQRILARLLASFAAMALLLVLIGIYGIVAYTVAQRTQEVCIRRALGARETNILRLVVGQSFRLALIGVALGIAAAVALTRLIESVLFHVSATDPATFATVAALFLLVATFAGYIPARRATKIDPAAALRT